MSKQQTITLDYYSVDIVRAKYPPGKRQVLGIVTIVSTVIALPIAALITRELDFKIDYVIEYSFLLSATLLFIMLRIFKKVINRTIKIGTVELIGKNLFVKTEHFHKTIPFDEIVAIKYKSSVKYLRGNTNPHNISETVLFSIISKDQSACTLHIVQRIYKNGIKQKDNLWTSDGNIFDILHRKKLKPIFEKQLKEADCLIS